MMARTRNNKTPFHDLDEIESRILRRLTELVEKTQLLREYASTQGARKSGNDGLRAIAEEWETATINLYDHAPKQVPPRIRREFWEIPSIKCLRAIHFRIAKPDDLDKLPSPIREKFENVGGAEIKHIDCNDVSDIVLCLLDRRLRVDWPDTNEASNEARQYFEKCWSIAGKHPQDFQLAPRSIEAIVTTIIQIVQETKKDIYEQLNEEYPQDEAARALRFRYINELDRISDSNLYEPDAWAWDDIWIAIHDNWPDLACKITEDAILKACDAGLLCTQPLKISHENREINLREWFAIPKILRPTIYFHVVSRPTLTHSAEYSTIEKQANLHIPATTRSPTNSTNNMTIDAQSMPISTKTSDKIEQPQIPFPNPSAPLSLSSAAATWGGDMTPAKLRGLMKSSAIQYVELNRQTFIFSRDEIPGLPANKKTPPN